MEGRFDLYDRIASLERTREDDATRLNQMSSVVEERDKEVRPT